ncbi:MAG: PilZ domain-containing protein [Proteobacteria bacterium]|nr:PilZ domain-containing protein [Pseudomonadota bacterium]
MSRSGGLRALLLHDGELAELRPLLSELGVSEIDESESRAFELKRDAPWQLLLTTPLRALEVETRSCDVPPVHVAVTDDVSRTQRALLVRAGVDYIVRRPVHPDALRLLLLHSLYRGPERRHTSRVSVGAPVRVHSGLRRGRALLGELSTRGCTLIGRRSPPVGRRVQVSLSRSLAGGSALTVRGLVVRRLRAAREDRDHDRVAVVFEPMDAGVRDRLTAIVARFAKGPASLGPPRRREAAPAQPEAPSATLAAEPEDRRRASRHRYSRRVIALSAEATRVLLGRDLSIGGMRVDANPSLGVGDRLRVAVHTMAGEEPLVLDAHVARDDGGDGLVLVFEDVEAPTREMLAKRIAELPPVLAPGSSGEDGAEPEALAIAEIVTEERAV